MGTSTRGFASMSPEKQKEIASKGGKAAHQKGTAHQFTSEEARQAGRKGGQASGQARAAGRKDDEKTESGHNAGHAQPSGRST
jgi:general stress protein YciG